MSLVSVLCPSCVALHGGSIACVASMLLPVEDPLPPPMLRSGGPRLRISVKDGKFRPFPTRAAGSDGAEEPRVLRMP